MRGFYPAGIAVFLFGWGAGAQIVNPVRWSVDVRRVDTQLWHVELEASLDEGWHVYAQDIPEGGPVPTSLRISVSQGGRVVGEPEWIGERHELFDSVFEMNVAWYEDSLKIIVPIEVERSPVEVSLEVEYMACDNARCLPPTTEQFTVVLPPSGEQVVKSVGTGFAAGAKPTLVRVFALGFLGGLVALFTPCVLPMIPLTVSYFSKREGRRVSAVMDAVVYALSIVVLYVLLGLGVTIVLGPSAMNELASNGVVNMLFFVIFVVFALSFFGLFELSLPSSWLTTLDRAAGRHGGFLGIVFMAFTLAVVSFSCTGPIIGTLLVEAALMGERLGPFVGMLGFAMALALPFALFSMFPSALSALPRSGQWMNTLKVSLGFLELALALKFLSNVDLAYGWNLITREAFIALWIIIFGLWGMYLLGLIRLRGERTREIHPVRLLAAIVVLAFAAYLVPGLWGAPLRLVSGFPPPIFYREWQTPALSPYSHSDRGSSLSGTAHRLGLMCPLDLRCVHDLGEALALARKENKPVLIDFTGWTCINCRKMEERVWPHPEVWRILNEEVILASLYVDDKTPLPPGRQYVSGVTGRRITTVGQFWSDFQARVFGANSQPYYVMIDHDTTLLTQPVGYTPDPEKFVEFLKKGLEAFRQKRVHTGAPPAGASPHPDTLFRWEVQ